MTPTDLEALRERVAVKPLEWRRPFPNLHMNCADTIIAQYRVFTHKGADGWFWQMALGQTVPAAGELSAKAAAQADYEARILSALIAQQADA